MIYYILRRLAVIGGEGKKCIVQGRRAKGEGRRAKGEEQLYQLRFIMLINVVL